MKVLILCTGNSCRSQMAEGLLKSFDKDSRLEVFSAGTEPAKQVNPRAIKVMLEEGIDLSLNKPTNVSEFLDTAWDFVITVCGGANESCPTFSGKVAHRLHIGFEDPAEVSGSEEYILSEFRRIRDQIREGFYAFYQDKLLNEADAE